MKDLLIDFDQMKAGQKALKKLAQAFTRAGSNVASVDVDDKTRRSSGVTYREVHLTMVDNQKVTIAVKSTGDIFQVKVNGSVVPMKNQEDQRKAVAELVKILDAGRAKFQAKLAKVKAQLPKGVKATAPKLEVALKAKVEQLDSEIAEAEKKVAELKAELGGQSDSPLPPEKISRKQVIDSLVWRDLGQRDKVKTIALYFPDPTNPSSGSAQMKAAEVWKNEGSKNWMVDNEAGSYSSLSSAKARAVEIAVQKAAEWGYSTLDSVSTELAFGDLQEALELSGSIIAGEVFDNVDAAKATIQAALDIAENNAPIHEAEGDEAQAAYCREAADQYREALSVLDGSAVLDGAGDDQESLFDADDEGDEGDEEENPDQESLFDAVPRAVGKKLAEIGKTYWRQIPLKELFAAVEAAGLKPVDEDGEPWEGMLTGREGRTVIDLMKDGKVVRETLSIQWHKMPSGNYEVNAYVG